MALLLDPLFSPKSVAVIGASANQDRTGYKFTHELLMRFPGKVFPINPKGGEVDGRPMYKSMAEAGEPADLALILVNKKAALAAVTDCAAHGVKVGVMYTAGFGEMGEEGARIQQEMVRVANEHGMRLVGPNCMGVFSHPAGLNLTGEEIPGGDIALISQSGNIGFSLWYDAANYLHTGFSRFVGFGNQADIAVHEYIDYCADDPMSKVIVIYLEGLRPGSGLDFIRSASAAAKKKPVVILKGGRSTAGKRAASSHTGSLAGNEALYSAAFEKAGIVEVKRLDELMPVAQTLMLCPPLKSGNIIVGGTGGGHMIVSTDAAEREGFCMPPFSPGG
ncbi:MAG: CoA-binding protein [Oscillospiraceae bacterium]